MSDTPPSEPTPPVPPAPPSDGPTPPSPTPPEAPPQQPGPAYGQPAYGQPAQPAYGQATHPGYGQAQYGQPGYGYPAASPTNTLAIVSLVCSLVGLVVPFFAPVAGIITGHIALGQIKRTAQQGRGMALAGVIVGYALAGVTVLVFVVWIVFIVVFASTVGAACASDPSGCTS